VDNEVGTVLVVGIVDVVDSEVVPKVEVDVVVVVGCWPVVVVTTV